MIQRKEHDLDLEDLSLSSLAVSRHKTMGKTLNLMPQFLQPTILYGYSKNHNINF